MTDTPIKQFQDYRIVNEISRGGNGVVYKAKHVTSNKTYALKLLLDVENDQARQRFQREAKALSQVKHPNVISLIDYGDHEGTPYLVMSYIRGKTLREYIEQSLEKSGHVPSFRWLEMTCLGILEGLQACHGQALYHRDLKPSNIIIEQHTQSPVLIDFGLVMKDKRFGRLDSISISKSNAIIGTPRYMAPEQFDSEEFGPIGEQTDVWGFGATVFYCLTGRPVYLSDTLVKLISTVLMEEPPRASEIDPNIPPFFDNFCARCLVKDGRKRARIELLLKQIHQKRSKESNRARNLEIIERKNDTGQTNSSVTGSLRILAFVSVVLITTIIGTTVLYPLVDPAGSRKTNLDSESLSAQVELLNSADLKTKAAARKKLLEAGRAATPFLIEGLRGDDSESDYQLNDILKVLGKESLPALVIALNAPSQRKQDAVIKTLMEMHAISVPALVEALNDKNRIRRVNAAITLGKIGAAAQGATHALSKNLNHPDRRSCLAAAKALGQIGPGAKAALPALKARVNTSDHEFKVILKQACDKIEQP
ncbi:MAG: protein kinase [Planctomycetota bacterium]|nr:protein kinase [Planctomycetota bacterium]